VLPAFQTRIFDFLKGSGIEHKSDGWVPWISDDGSRLAMKVFTWAAIAVSIKLIMGLKNPVFGTHGS